MGPVISEIWTDEASGRKVYLDLPDDVATRDDLTFILNLHGGGSVGGVAAALLPGP